MNGMSLALKLGSHLAKYLAYTVNHLSSSSLIINLLPCLAMNCLSSECISLYTLIAFILKAQPSADHERGMSTEQLVSEEFSVLSDSVSSAQVQQE